MTRFANRYSIRSSAVGIPTITPDSGSPRHVRSGEATAGMWDAKANRAAPRSRCGCRRCELCGRRRALRAVQALKLIDQRRAAQIEQPGGLTLVAAGLFEAPQD